MFLSGEKCCFFYLGTIRATKPVSNFNISVYRLQTPGGEGIGCKSKTWQDLGAMGRQPQILL